LFLFDIYFIYLFGCFENCLDGNAGWFSFITFCTSSFSGGAILLRFVASADIGATRTMIGIFEYFRMALLKRYELPTAPLLKRGELINEVVRRIEQFSRENEKAELISVGVGSIGPLNLRHGSVIYSPNVGRASFEVKRPLEESLSAPVHIVNDCAAAVYGEFMAGHGVGKRNIVYVTLSTGIGAGTVVDGRLIFGKDGNAHEVGHLVISYDSDIECGCGGRGHWEGLASGKNLWKIVEKIRSRSAEHTKIKSEVIYPEELFSNWREGDTFASRVVEELAKINAAGIASVINAYDPELLIIGGSIALKNKPFIDMILSRVSEYAINRLPEFAPPYYGDDSVLVGAAWIARKPPLELLQLEDGV